MDLPSSPRPKTRILALSGGGYLGLFTAAVLEHLERWEGRNGAPLAHSFDLVAGTSIGGILALGVACEVPLAHIRQAFQEHGVAIFSRRRPQRSIGQAWADLGRVLGQSKYTADTLRAVVADLVGTQTRLGDLKHRVLVPAMNLTQGSPELFKTPHHPNNAWDADLKVLDVAMATAAAPTYFPLVQVQHDWFADGGLFANAPDLLAYHEMRHFLHVPEPDIHVVSVGTATSMPTIDPPRHPSWGLFQWFRRHRLLQVMVGAQQHSVDLVLRQLLDGRYLRLDAIPTAQERACLGLDIANAHAQEVLMSLAARVAAAWSSHALLREVLTDPRAPSPTFVAPAEETQPRRRWS